MNKTQRSWKRRIASLRRAVHAGDVAAMSELGLDLLEGIQDRRGNVLVRRDPRTAFHLLSEAAARGDVYAMASLGYTYDLGLGTMRNQRQALRWYRRASRLGSSMAATCAATVYRDARKPRLAFHWWRRSAAMDDGDAMADVGYCYQYGIGVRRNSRAATKAFKQAIKSRCITEFGREAAMYYLALLHVDGGRARLAVPLLKRADKDHDFPEASSVLRQIRAQTPVIACRCRRYVNKSLLGHTKCPMHS
jgi:TPR repeat protein